MASDPSYRARLEALPERDRKALLYGDWNIFDGQYFPEFSRDIHVSKPFDIPKEWRRYRAFDYGLDRLACYWIAVDSTRTAYVYRELCASDLPISTACERIIKDNGDDDIYLTLAPPDMWSRSQETGRSKAVLFDEHGVTLTKSNNNREAGWLAIKELLKIDNNGNSRLVIFDTCTELIKCLPALQVDPKRPTDCATEPHDITHAPDGLRYFAVYWTYPSAPAEEKRIRVRADVYEDYIAASPAERARMEKTYGGKLVLHEY
jgi:phage terminase large subunit